MTFFKKSCSGASISPDLTVSVLGDQFGTVRIFQNIPDFHNEMSVKHIVSYGVSSSVSCIHFHSFFPNLVFVGSNEGSLFGFNLPKIDNKGQVECSIDSGHIYQA